jgi:hypothetical protein
MPKSKTTLIDQLNRSSPIADDVKLGDLLNTMITNHNALCAKLDADAGVTDTNYAATLGIKPLGS